MQGLAQFVEHRGVEGGGVYIDVGRHHLHRIQVEVAAAEQGQDLLGDADAVDEGDVNSHGNAWLAKEGANYARSVVLR
ncbi:hypothetical protein D3C78_256720 [compost metagenome]